MTDLEIPKAQQRLALSTYVRLMRAADSVRSYAARTLTGSGLTLTQFAVLEALYHLGPMSLTDIAQKILTTGGNLTMVVRNLEKYALAQRRRSPGDGRVFIVALTPKGKKIIRDLFPDHAAAIARRMGALSVKEHKRLSDLCRKLGKNTAALD